MYANELNFDFILTLIEYKNDVSSLLLFYIVVLLSVRCRCSVTEHGLAFTKGTSQC